MIKAPLRLSADWSGGIKFALSNRVRISCDFLIRFSETLERIAFICRKTVDLDICEHRERGSECLGYRIKIFSHLFSS